MRHVLSVVIFCLGIALAAYTGGWLLFIKPIMECLKAFDSGLLTGVMVGATVLKCIFAGTVGSLIVWFSSIIAAIISN